MERDYFNGMTGQETRSWGMALPVLMRKVYTWMAMALAITGLVAYGVASSHNLVIAIFSNQVLFWGLLIGELAMVWYLSARLFQMSLTTATMMFVAYSVLNGVTMSCLFLVYTAASIATTFFICSGTFATMALIGYTTKMDLSKIGSVLFMALIGLIIASVVNMFVHSEGLYAIISYVGVLVFVGLTAWDTQKIKGWLSEYEYADETAQKVALFGALDLYLDFINLFIYLLRILGSRRN